METGLVAQTGARITRMVVIIFSLKRAAVPWEFNLFWNWKMFSASALMLYFYDQNQNQYVHEYLEIGYVICNHEVIISMLMIHFHLYHA